MTIAALIPIVLKISIALSVFAIGLKASFSDATYLFRRPSELLRAILSMNVVMPVIAVVLVELFDLRPAVKIALIALSVSPIPPILPNKALKAGGKEDYTIGLLVATALLSIVFVPAAIDVFQRIGRISLEMSALSIAVLVLTTILVPLILGIVVRALVPSLADKAANPIGLVAMIALVVCVLPVVLGMFRSFITFIGDGTLISLVAFAIVGCISGHLLGGPEPENRRVLGIATCSRHPAVAIAIAHANFPDQQLAVTAVLLYLVLGGIVSAVYLNWVKRSHVGTATTEKNAA